MRPFVVHATRGGLLKGIVTAVLEVHVHGDRIYFLQTADGVAANAGVLLASQGLLGWLIGNVFRRRKPAAGREVAGAPGSPPSRNDLEAAVRTDPANFVWTPRDVCAATIEPQNVAAPGAKATLNVELSSGETRVFLFPDTGDVSKAVRSLQRALGARLTVDIEWDRFADRWVRRR